METNTTKLKIRKGFIKKALLWTFGIIFVFILFLFAKSYIEESVGCKNVPGWANSLWGDDDSYHSVCYHWKKAGKPINQAIQTYPFTKESTTTEKASQIAYIKDIVLENNSYLITLDFVDVLEGQKAVEAIKKDGVCQTDCFPNGEIYFRNVNPALRKFYLLPDAEIKTATAFQIHDSGVVDVSVNYLLENYIRKFKDNPIPYDIYFDENNNVKTIKEIYRP